MKKTAKALTVLALSGALALTACGRATPPANTDTSSTDTSTSTSTNTGTTSNSLIVGTTDQVTTIDPAGSYDHGSLMVEVQVYQFLYSFVPGSNVPTPDAAQSCSFTQPTVFSCTLRDGLKFVNGDPLTSASVKFSFDRILTINDPNGPASLLENLDTIDTPDALTVNFNLKNPNDQTFAQVLATSAGPIVDEKVMSATALTPDNDIVAAKAFSGPYTITSYNQNDTIVFAPNPDYVGNAPAVANTGVTLKNFTDDTNLKMSISNGDIDVAYRSLTPTDIQSLQSDSNVKVWQAKGGEIRYITFNLKTMPGDTDAQKFAIRQAVAASIDRDALSTNVYKGQYTKLCSYVPDGYVGANTAVCDAYPLDATAAAKYLSDAGVTTPVTLNMQYNPDHYGSSSDQEYGLIKQQLEATGLFKVALQATAWVTYSKERTQDAYPVFQMGWFPDFPDADNYLSPFFTANSFLAQHFDQPDIQQMIAQEVSETDATARTTEIQNIQATLAQKYLPTLPLLQGSQWAVARTNVSGVSLGVSENLLFVSLTKS